MKKYFLFLFISLVSINITAQNSVSIDNYNRAVGFMWNNLDNKKVFNLYISANWFADSSGLWYEHHGKDMVEYRQLIFSSNKISPLFNHEKVAEILSDTLDEKVKATALPISRISFDQAGNLSVEAKNVEITIDTTKYQLVSHEKNQADNSLESTSPDKQWTAFTSKFNLFIKSASGDTIQLSSSGKLNYEYASWYGWFDKMYGENDKRPERFAVSWSDDSQWIGANICDLRTASKMYLLNWSIDSLYRPQLSSYYRGSPGDTNMIYMEPVFFNIRTREEIKIPNSRATHINATNTEWSEEPGKIYVTRRKRGYKEITISLFDLNSGKEELLLRETSPTNLDNFEHIIDEESGQIFFLSERSGWRQVYALDIKSKNVKPVTRGDYYVNEILRIDQHKKQVLFIASGKVPGKNPYLQDLYSIGFNGKKLKHLTNDDLHHQVSISPDGNYFLDNASDAATPTVTNLKEVSSGDIVKKIGEADVTALTNWSPPETFEVLARDGKTRIYGAIWKPTDFDTSAKYPIIDHSYTGPHTQMFPKDFRRLLSIGNQSYAELGFVVVMIDGLGSSGRSKKFHNYSYKNLGGNLADHIGALRQLAADRQWLDTTRVGIFGHSAGGYDAGHAVLAYPEFYKVAVASSADHDHRMEKAWWPEMYMGWPVDSAYHLQSNITMAGNLKGKLLITHGGIDDNVNPSATFKLAEALINADKQFDMLILPSQRHGYQGKHRQYFTKTRWNYFVEHLLGAEPIWDFEWE